MPKSCKLQPTGRDKQKEFTLRLRRGSCLPKDARILAALKRHGPALMGIVYCRLILMSAYGVIDIIRVCSRC